jgi:hypothetical protein
MVAIFRSILLCIFASNVVAQNRFLRDADRALEESVTLLDPKTVVVKTEAEQTVFSSYSLGDLFNSTLPRKKTIRRRTVLDEFIDPRSEVKKNHVIKRCEWPSQPMLYDSNLEYVDKYNKDMDEFRSRVQAEYSFMKAMQFSSIPQLTDGSFEAQTDNKLNVPRIEFLYDGKLLLRRDCDFQGCLPKVSAWNDKHAIVDADLNLVHPDRDLEFDQKPEQKSIIGDHIYFSVWFPGNYGHILHDHLPFIAWLKENIDPEVKFLLLYHQVLEDILNIVDPTFIASRVTWINYSNIYHVTKGRLTIFVNAYVNRNLFFIESLRSWFLASNLDHRALPTNQTVIYYTRNGPGTNNGRIIDSNHENDIISVIKQVMIRLNRPEQLIIFDGHEHGEKMELRRQFHLFRSASTVIGSHGSGLANIVWMDPSNAILPPVNTMDYNCPKDRPKVLEFLLGPQSAHVRPPCHGCALKPFTATYYHLYSSMPWTEYHHILYAPNSTRDVTFVSLTALNSALESMWSA